MIGQNICHIAVLGDGSLDIRLVRSGVVNPLVRPMPLTPRKALRKNGTAQWPADLRPDDGLRRRLDLPANEKDLEPPPRQPPGRGKNPLVTIWMLGSVI